MKSYLGTWGGFDEHKSFGTAKIGHKDKAAWELEQNTPTYFVYLSFHDLSLQFQNFFPKESASEASGIAKAGHKSQGAW